MGRPVNVFGQKGYIISFHPGFNHLSPDIYKVKLSDGSEVFVPSKNVEIMLDESPWSKQYVPSTRSCTEEEKSLPDFWKTEPLPSQTSESGLLPIAMSGMRNLFFGTTFTTQMAEPEKVKLPLLFSLAALTVFFPYFLHSSPLSDLLFLIHSLIVIYTFCLDCSRIRKLAILLGLLSSSLSLKVCRYILR